MEELKWKYELSTKKDKSIKSFFMQWEWLLVVILILIVTFNSSISENFFTVNTFLTAPMSFMDKAFMVLPMTFILLLGMIDISVGSIVALSAVMMGLAFQSGAPMWLAIVASLFTGIICGVINGLLNTKFSELPPMILTFATQTIFRGFSYVLLENNSISGFPTWYTKLGWGSVAGIPIIMLVFIVIAILFTAVLHKTVFGREIYAIGFNKRTSIISGVKVNKNIMIVFTLMGLMAAVTSLFLTSRMSSVRADIGMGYELEVIAMVVLGGVNTSGGIGRILGPIISVFIIGFLRYGLGIANVSSQIITLIIGVLLIVSVLVTRIKIKNKKI